MGYDAIIKQLGHDIQPVDLVLGKFVQGVQTGNLIFTSGQVPIWGDRTIKGKVGGDLTLEDGQEAARLCVLNCLRVVKTLTGSLDKVTRIVKILGMVNVAPGFDATSAVINGATDLIREVFGDAGAHARSAVGMTLPMNFAVEVEMIVEVKS